MALALIQISLEKMSVMIPITKNHQMNLWVIIVKKIYPNIEK